MAGSILEQFAELKSDYEIGKASRYKRAKTGIITLGSHADYHYRTEAFAKRGQDPFAGTARRVLCTKGS